MGNRLQYKGSPGSQEGAATDQTAEPLKILSSYMKVKLRRNEKRLESSSMTQQTSDWFQLLLVDQQSEGNSHLTLALIN